MKTQNKSASDQERREYRRKTILANLRLMAREEQDKIEKELREHKSIRTMGCKLTQTKCHIQ